MNFTQDLRLLLKSRHPIIIVNTREEDRLEYIIKNKLHCSNNQQVYCWDFVDGYISNPNDNGYAKRNPLLALEFIENLSNESLNLFILKDFDSFLSEIVLVRKLRNLAKVIKTQTKHIIIISCKINIPFALKDIITIIDLPLPNLVEIKKEIIRLSKALNLNLDSELINNMTKSCQGLSVDRIRKVITKIIAQYSHLDSRSLPIIIEEKRQIINQTRLLEFYPYVKANKEIGGLDVLKGWLQKRSSSFSKQSLNYGIPSPKGLLLVGIQGTGKSLTAKAIANDWMLPLLRLDIGKLFGGLVGESESKMREMIDITEGLSPCILWIDEIDKAFSGLYSQGDSGTSARVFGTFITWLSEKKSSVFVVATANKIQNLPSEMLRKGRFDEIFFLDLPNHQERQSIFKIHLSKVRPKSWQKYDIEQLSLLCNKFSGAEIEQAIIESMHTAFNEKREFCTEDIKVAIQQFVPLAFTDKEQIESLQAWAGDGRARNASLT
nr:Ycf46 protein [Pyropia sp. Myanmar_A]BED43296.1 Ycf46 protein [Pyropia sp. Myanmar_B]BED43493.1 Ycf46 protein [Pyropia sp. Myanmar_C]